MLASQWPVPFDHPDWVFELKWDGVRCILSTLGGEVGLRSRAGNDMTGRYPELANLDLPSDLVLDGEIVAFDPDGRPSFELLQGRMNVSGGTGRIPISYVVFDLLHHGESLLGLSIEERWDRLGRLELPAPMVVADRFLGESAAIWQFVEANDLEGIVAKKLGSTYLPGVRSADWRKISHFKQLRAVVGGYTVGTGGRASTFGSLLLGLWDGDKLRWIGAVGSGFNEQSLKAVHEALSQMRVSNSPFHADEGIPAGSTWVDPQLVAMVRYKQWTTGARVRAPSFKGFTDDPISSITWEAEGPTSGSIDP